jgi:predicted nucleotidyltransferase
MTLLDPQRRTRIRSLLQSAFGARLRGVILFGSEARAEARDDSDVDVMVVLAPPVSLAADLRTAIVALQPLRDELDRPIHATPVPEDAFRAAEFALYREAQAHGVVL